MGQFRRYKALRGEIDERSRDLVSVSGSETFDKTFTKDGPHTHA